MKTKMMNFLVKKDHNYKTTQTMSCFLHKESSLNARQALIEQKLINDNSSFRLNNVIRFREWLANVVGEIKKYLFQIRGQEFFENNLYLVKTRYLHHFEL